MSQTFSHNSPYLQKQVSIRLTPYLWQPSICNVVTSQKVGSLCYQLVVAFLFENFSQKLCLLRCHKIAKCRVANGTELKGLNRIFPEKGIVEKHLGLLFITLNSSYFFNKTDFEQYLFSSS